MSFYYPGLSCFRPQYPFALKLYHKIVFINKNLILLNRAGFCDLADDLKGVAKVGFLTDKDMSAEKMTAFLQAQYLLPRQC